MSSKWFHKGNILCLDLDGDIREIMTYPTETGAEVAAKSRNREIEIIKNGVNSQGRRNSMRAYYEKRKKERDGNE